MKIPRPSERLALPRGLLAAFVAAIILPSAMLVMLGVRLLDQDRALEERRRREIAEAALERAASTLQKDLASSQRRLAAGHSWPLLELAPGAVHLRGGSGPLLYLPIAPALPEPPTEPFAESDRFEFQSGDSAKALALCQRLAASPAAPLRAGALVRIARLHRKADRLDDALAAWSNLASIPGVAIAGEPAGLMARRARCRALEQANRTIELRKEAALLLAELHSARWPLDRETYLLAAQQANQWLGSDPQPPAEKQTQAAAFFTLWPQRKSSEGSLCHDGYTLIWFGDNALLAGPLYRTTHWEKASGVQLACPGEPAPQGLGRQTSTTGLPWNITAILDQQPLPEFSSRRAALLSAFVALFVLICAVAYFAWRAVARELGVARLQSDFVAAVSHEFRTPLTSLRQFNEMLTDEADLPADVRLRYYQAQGRATDRLSRLVETLLDFGRMEAGRRPYQLEPIDAAALVRAVAEEFSKEAQARGFDIQCRTPDHPLTIQADREAIGRALWNLLDNAVKYSGDSRAMLIEASPNGAGIAIQVTDHGLGIPQHEQPRLFQKFVRGESSRIRGIPGTGIGLAMVRHIVEAHGGRVELVSVEGEGSTFRLLLPGRR